MKFETARIHVLSDDFAAVAEKCIFYQSFEIKYSGNVFKAVKNTHSTCFKHYLKQLQNRSRAACIVASLGYETRSQKVSLKFLIKIA